jgi:hypothetical protein
LEQCNCSLILLRAKYVSHNSLPIATRDLCFYSNQEFNLGTNLLADVGAGNTVSYNYINWIAGIDDDYSRVLEITKDNIRRSYNTKMNNLIVHAIADLIILNGKTLTTRTPSMKLDHTLYRRFQEEQAM